MNISSEIFPTDGSNSSDHNTTEGETFENIFFVDIITILLSLPTNSYVIWLIVTGTGNGLASEFFSLNLSLCEMLICVESVISLLMYNFQFLRPVVDFMDGFAITGRPLFQCVICVERYLAVVHPVTFLKSKPLRYRLICCVIVWAAGFVSCGVNLMVLSLSLMTLYFAYFFVQFFLFFSFQVFCSLAVLRALKHSGPGDRKREREEENHMKRRAFQVILITHVTLAFLYAPYVIFIVPNWISGKFNDTISSISYVFFTLSSLVQPLAFFYRVGKLPFMNWQ